MFLTKELKHIGKRYCGLPTKRILHVSIGDVSDNHNNYDNYIHARLISSCALRLEDEVIRDAVRLSLGVDACHPHNFLAVLYSINSKNLPVYECC